MKEYNGQQLKTMRTIKFRAWDGEKFTSPDYITMDGTAYWKENSLIETSPIINQYTGLKDKNGVEIYEGDIMIAMINSTLAEAEVKFYNGCFYLQHISVEKMAIPLAEQYYWQEIIGNIYENPDLLK